MLLSAVGSSLQLLAGVPPPPLLLLLPPSLVAALDYGTFRGAYSEAYNISYWQKIPYAAPPVGENRFRAPQPPVRLPEGAVYDSSRVFDMCPQRTVGSVCPPPLPPSLSVCLSVAARRCMCTYT